MVKKQIDKNTEVLLTNNTHASYVYLSPNESVLFKLPNQGDEDYIAFGDLKTMVSRQRQFFEGGRVLITAVDEEGLDIADVYDSLRLTKVENDFTKTFGDYGEFAPEVARFEEFVLESEDVEFKKAISKSGPFHMALIETAVKLQQEGKLTDYNKMTAIQESRNSEFSDDLWKDIAASSAV